MANEDSTPAIEAIRSELRQVVEEERKYNRGAALNKNRTSLGEIVEKKCTWDTKLVETKAKVLAKKALPMDDYLSLQNALIESEENVKSFLKVERALRALVRDLSSFNPAVQLVAANCCCNLALSDSKICTILAKAAGPYLTAELDTLNYPLVEVCAWTIGNLASHGGAAFRALYAQGCLKGLESLLRDAEPGILPSVVYAIGHCLYGGFDIITDSDVTDLAHAIVVDQSRFNDANILWLAAILSSREACVNILCPILPAIFNHLYSTLESNDVQEISAAIRIFGNTVSEASGKAADAILCRPAGSLKIFFEKLLCHSQPHIRKETLWLIGNLYFHELPRITEIMRKLVVELPSLERLHQLEKNERIS